MASYSDFIQMQNYLPVYDITAESSNRLWASFIPTNQFCDLLQQTMTAVSSSDKFKRKSIWVQGTFGTGKSHASSVVRHLLCDRYEDVNFYFNKIEDPSLRAQVDNFRKNKHFFSVVIKGVEGAYDLPRFSLSLQRQVKEALNAAGYSNIVVKSDFESAVQYVEAHMQYTQDAIDKHEDLKDIAPTPESVISLLKDNNIQAYMELEEALYKTVGVPLTTKNVSEWLAEVEHAIETEGIADGLIIFWDEFTSIMEAIGSDRINVLQNIAEKSQSCNLFLFLISHRVEDQVTSGSKREDVKTMNDRFYTIRYMMDEVSTYKVMRHTFDIQGDDAYAQLRYNRTVKLNELIDYLCEGGVEDERKSILELFPMHPYSAFLCSKLSDYVGSANRSVVNFMNDDKKGFRKFITDESVYELRGLLTAEWLWDFFFDSFAANPLCGAFTSNFQNHIHRVQEAGDDYVRVYKGILLLNTLSTQFATKSSDIIARISPNEKSIRGLFADDRLEPKMDDILRFLDTNQIIARDVFGEFKISVSFLNPAEIAKEKEKVTVQFKTANDYLNYNFAAKTNITKLFTVGEYLIRRCEPQLFSCSDQESVIRAKLNKYTSEKPNTLHVAIYLAVTEEERRAFENRVKDFSSEFLNTINIIPDEVLTNEVRTKFIDLIANHNVAKSHYQESIEKESELAAKLLINKWGNRLVNGSFNLYFNGEQTREGIVGNIYSLINKKFSVRVFPKGMEAIKAYRMGVTKTFLANKNFPALVLQMLQSPTRDKLVKFSGSDIPAKYIFEENDNHLVDEECKLTSAAITGEAWIAQVCQEVDQCIEDAKKKYVDKFSLSEIFAPLMRPPFGFFPSRANWVAFAYALRKHKADLFVTTISQPISDEKLSEMIVELFKMWNDGHSEASNKLMLRFGSKEESELTQLLYDVFQLQFIKDIPEVKSLSNVRWGINEFCMQKSKYPLWVLTYCDNINENRSAIIKLLIEVLESDQNPDIAKIKNLYRLVNGEKMDIAQLVSNPNNYENGFLNFINSMKNVKIQRDWWNELIEEISHLQSEVAFRKESDVRECVLNFYISKVDAQKPAQPAKPATPDTPGGSAPAYPGDAPVTPAPEPIKKPVDQDTVKKAKNLVKEANMPGVLWQKVVLDIIEANPEVAEFITNYLS